MPQFLDPFIHSCPQGLLPCFGYCEDGAMDIRHRYLFEFLLSVLLSIYPHMELLELVVVPWLIILEPFSFSRVPVPFCIPWSSAEEFQLLHIFTSICYFVCVCVCFLTTLSLLMDMCFKLYNFLFYADTVESYRVQAMIYQNGPSQFLFPFCSTRKFWVFFKKICCFFEGNQKCHGILLFCQEILFICCQGILNACFTISDLVPEAGKKGFEDGLWESIPHPAKQRWSHSF